MKEYGDIADYVGRMKESLSQSSGYAFAKKIVDGEVIYFKYDGVNKYKIYEEEVPTALMNFFNQGCIK